MTDLKIRDCVEFKERTYSGGYKCIWCDVSTAKKKLKDGFCGYCRKKHKREHDTWRVADSLMMPIVKILEGARND